MFPNRNQGQSQQPINLYRPGTGPQSPQGSIVQGPSSAPQMLTQFMDNKKAEGSKTIIIFVLAILVAIFAGLFVWKFLDWSNVNSTIDYKVEQRVADQERQIGDRLEAAYEAERNSDTTTFLGPNVYGSLTFSYPKTWSAYIEKDESLNNGIYSAYLNPSSVGPITADSVFALRIRIENTDIKQAVASYDKEVMDGTMTSSAVSLNNSSLSATVYTKNDNSSKIAVFKIPNRNQVVILSTDSAKNFGKDFQNILDSIEIDS